MSVVAAKVYKEKIVIAADSILVEGWSKDTSGNFAKLSLINSMIIGSVGNADETSLMWHYAKTHKPSDADEKSMLDFMVEFFKWKKDILSDNTIVNSYIIAYDGHLFRTNGMFVCSIKDYCAIGAGMDFANAALYLGHSPKEAVKVSCDLSCFVAEPILEEEMKIR